MRNLVPWEPFRELADFGSIFDRFFGRNLAHRRPALGVLGDGIWSPAIDVYYEKDRIRILARMISS